jgi:hypothetical protein
VRGRYVDANDNSKPIDLPFDTEESDNLDDLEPALRTMFPLPGTVAHTEQQPLQTYTRDAPDWLELEPDDPLWLDMEWPTEAGPESSAYARHLQWKRSLKDGERVRWQKWAIYERMLKKGQFDYSVEDFIRQSMVSDIARKAAHYRREQRLLEANLWGTYSVPCLSFSLSDYLCVPAFFGNTWNESNDHHPLDPPPSIIWIYSLLIIT